MQITFDYQNVYHIPGLVEDFFWIRKKLLILISSILIGHNLGMQSLIVIVSPLILL